MFKINKFAIALGLCGAMASGAAAADMKVGALFPFSGALALLGQESYRGLELAVNEIKMCIRDSFHRQQDARLPGRRQHRLAVQRLDGGHVDHAHRQAVLAQPGGGFQRRVQRDAAGDDVQVAAARMDDGAAEGCLLYTSRCV